MIVRTAKKFFNPIREHLRIVPREVAPDARLSAIAEYLEQDEFDPNTSRALVFATTRQQTEDLAEEFMRTQERWKDAVGFFHAGMSGEEREEAYRGFKSGELVMLFATKAFGMGMDIPNIHYVFHFWTIGVDSGYRMLADCLDCGNFYRINESWYEERF